MVNHDSLKIDYEKFFLSNGVKCVLYKRPELHSVNIRVTVNVGSLDETPDTNGISHFLEHVVHDGTKQLPTWEAIDDYLNQYSGSANAYTSYDHTQYHGTFPSQYAKEALNYFSQVVLHPLLKESDINKERTVILDERRGYQDNIQYLLYQNMKRMRFAQNNDSYSYEVIGSDENIRKFGRQDILDFYEKYYVAENIEIYIVGNFSEDEMKSELTRLFHEDIKGSHSKPKPKKQYKEQYPEYSVEKFGAIQKRDIDQMYLTLSFPAPSFKDSSFVTRNQIDFLSMMTASSSYMQSILWKRLREELNLVYGVYAFDYQMYARNMFGIYVAFKGDVLETVLTEIHTGLELIKSKAVNDGVFKARQKKLLDTQLMRLDNPSNVLEWIYDYEDELEEHGESMTLGEFLEYVSEEQFENIIKLSNEIFDWEKVNIGIVSNRDETELENKTKSYWEKIKSSSKAQMGLF